MKNLIIASTSSLHRGDYLDYLKEELIVHFQGIKKILFIPYARPGGISHQDYTKKAQLFFNKINIDVQGLHQFEYSKKAIENAEGFFCGGGNTFLLVSELHKNNLFFPLKQKLEAGSPYLGTSAGSNICGINMQTTNDMPIVYPKSFETLGLVPFNINPHYLDQDLQSKHMGETRETRIKEFHVFNDIPVLGLREGSWLEVKAEKTLLKGDFSARLFIKNMPPKEILSGSDLGFIK